MRRLHEFHNERFDRTGVYTVGVVACWKDRDFPNREPLIDGAGVGGALLLFWELGRILCRRGRHDEEQRR